MYNLVLVSIENATRSTAKNFGVTNETIQAVQQINKCSKVILCLHGNPYSLAKFDGSENLDAIVLSYERNDYCFKIGAELIFGGVQSPGKIPVTVPGKFKEGAGFNIEKNRKNLIHTEAE